MVPVIKTLKAVDHCTASEQPSVGSIVFKNNKNLSCFNGRQKGQIIDLCFRDISYYSMSTFPTDQRSLPYSF